TSQRVPVDQRPQQLHDEERLAAGSTDDLPGGGRLELQQLLYRRTVSVRGERTADMWRHRGHRTHPLQRIGGPRRLHAEIVACGDDEQRLDRLLPTPAEQELDELDAVVTPLDVVQPDTYWTIECDPAKHLLDEQKAFARGVQVGTGNIGFVIDGVRRQ